MASLAISVANRFLKGDEVSEVRGLTQGDSRAINFVVGCLFCQAISIAEMKEWALRLIVENQVEDIPPYIFDLLDCEESIDSVMDAIGFAPDDNEVPTLESEIYGIAFMRGVDVYDPPISRADAEKAIRNSPSVMDEFATAFPFIAPVDMERQN
ncbi:hypothetical protein [Nocardia sp. NPDC058666]|uniref:hypothetical protein n=1 Tax=Nocardia sp. NPDC058666 TaxID=3346587 RepID=UPI00364F863D